MRLAAMTSLAVFTALGGCVFSSTHQAALGRAAHKQKELEDRVAELTEAQRELNEEARFLATKLDQREAQLTINADEIAEIDARLTERDAQLSSAQRHTESLSSTVDAQREVEKRLRDEQERLRQDRDALKEEKAKLTVERQDLEKEVAELRRLRAAAETRNQEFRELLTRLHKMIDAGSLEVKHRNGLMLVALPSDVLFAPGEAILKPEAIAALTELAQTLKTFEGRRFQVVGHSDSQPISNEQFPSNWELSTARALAVMKVLLDAGVPPRMLSAAGAAEYDPVAKNNNPTNRAMNRRVELVFVPRLAELPGFEGIIEE